MEAHFNQPNVKEVNEVGTEEKMNLDEEKEFVNLFDEVLMQTKGMLKEEEIDSGVEEVIEIFKTNITGSVVYENLSKERKALGFFYRYSPLFAGITRTRILTALRNCEELRSCFRRTSLKVVDVGSGAGSELVGLFSAIESFEENINEKFVKGFPFKSLEVTAIDYNPKLEVFFNRTVEKLRTGNFGNASKLFREKDIRCSFLCKDLLNHEKLVGEKRLNKADIVLMKGFLSVLEYNSHRYQIIEVVVSAMKPGSLLVIIESPTYEQYFQNENLRLVFTTRKYLPTSTDSQQHCMHQNISLESQDSELPPLAARSCSDVQSSTSQREAVALQENDSGFQASGSESDLSWEPYYEAKQPNTNDYYRFDAPPVRIYGRGLAPRSNQQIFVLVKTQ